MFTVWAQPPFDPGSDLTSTLLFTWATCGRPSLGLRLLSIYLSVYRRIDKHVSLRVGQRCANATIVLLIGSDLILLCVVQSVISDVIKSSSWSFACCEITLRFAVFRKVERHVKLEMS